MRYFILFFALQAFSCRGTNQGDQSSVLDLPAFHRQYRLGETFGYLMKGKNQGRDETEQYTAYSHHTIVERQGCPVGVDCSDGTGLVTFLVEEIQWSNLVVNGQPQPINENFRQYLSLQKGYRLEVPDMSSVEKLAGPITDLLTFYADASPVLSKDRLENIGDVVSIPHGQPNSWASMNPQVFSVAEDCVDFKFGLIQKSADQALLRADHDPPRTQCPIQLAAAWMKTPVVEGRFNNWVQVINVPSNDTTAHLVQVGSETFSADLTLKQENGRIVKASLNNPVQVREQFCIDQQLAQCQAERHYTILREISIELL